MARKPSAILDAGTAGDPADTSTKAELLAKELLKMKKKARVLAAQILATTRELEELTNDGTRPKGVKPPRARR